jgi:hypothetical protein
MLQQFAHHAASAALLAAVWGQQLHVEDEGGVGGDEAPPGPPGPIAQLCSRAQAAVDGHSWLAGNHVQQPGSGQQLPALGTGRNTNANHEKPFRCTTVINPILRRCGAVSNKSAVGRHPFQVPTTWHT